ncbi:MAG TPA: hypothetical protein VHG72_22315 [Polyangia bacterium]|nr:hypothetical protein [Polyangia bacterium]
MIAVVTAPMTDPAMTEALNRFKGEAASVGFRVIVVPGSAAATPVAQMDLIAHTTSADATIAFVNGSDPRALDVWFTDRRTGQTLVGHVSVQNESGDRASMVLAVKAVDFLRARMFDFLLARPKSLSDETTHPASPLVSPVAGVSSPPQGRRFGFGFSIGIDALQSLQGLGTMVLPLLRASYDIAAWSSFRLTIAGLGTRSDLNVMGGGAAVSEELAMAEWAVMPRRSRVRPFLSIGAGVHDIRAQGTAVAPYTARAASQVSMAGALSGGLRSPLNRHLAMSAEAGAFLLFPEPQVSIAGLAGGRTGRPALFATVAVEARF